MAIRVKEAANMLGVTAQTVRNWCNEGKLEYTTSIAGQRVFNKEYLQRIINEKNNIIIKPKILYYVRSSNDNDILIETQINKLKNNYEEPDKIYQDKASGLNENRKGLNNLINDVIKSETPMKLYITNKDRLTRFGYNYLEKMFTTNQCEIIVLDSNETKEPYEILMQDFMSLLASFSGKFYRLRGWEQRKKFLKNVQEEVDKREQE